MAIREIKVKKNFPLLLKRFPKNKSSAINIIIPYKEVEIVGNNRKK